jgi:hypothetical protein
VRKLHDRRDQKSTAKNSRFQPYQKATASDLPNHACDHGDKLRCLQDLCHLDLKDIDRGVYNDEILNPKSYPLDIKHIKELELAPNSDTAIFPFQFSFCDGESGIPFQPQDAFDFWQCSEAVTMDFHLCCEGSLNIDDPKFLLAHYLPGSS